MKPCTELVRDAQAGMNYAWIVLMMVWENHRYTGMEPSYEVLKILTHLVDFGNKNLSLNCMHFFDNHSEVSTLRYGPVPTKAIFL